MKKKIKKNTNQENNFSKDSNTQIIRSLNKSKRRAIFTNATITISITLLILPIFTIFTLIYYGYGFDESRGNEFLKVVESTISITEPNLIVDGDHINHDIDLFSMTGDFQLYKKVGLENKFVRTESYKLWFSQLDQPKKILGQNNYFIHPSQPLNIPNKDSVNQILQKLPEGTVSEMFISFDSLYHEKDIKNIFNDFDVELIWYAVSIEDHVGEYNQVIGYPAQTRNINSSFNEEKSNQEQLSNVLQFLSKHENWVEAITKNLNIKEVKEYIDHNGIQIYGATVTGPTKEFLNIGELKEIREYHLGDVELWNWK